MASHCICITYFSYKAVAKYVSIYPINFIKALRALSKCFPLGIFLCVTLKQRVTGEEAWRDKGHWRSRKCSVQPSRAGLYNM